MGWNLFSPHPPTWEEDKLGISISASLTSQCKTTMKGIWKEIELSGIDSYREPITERLMLSNCIQYSSWETVDTYKINE